MRFSTTNDKAYIQSLWSGGFFPFLFSISFSRGTSTRTNTKQGIVSSTCFFSPLISFLSFGDGLLLYEGSLWVFGVIFGLNWELSWVWVMSILFPSYRPVAFVPRTLNPICGWTFHAIIGSGLDLKGITNAMIYDHFLLFRGSLNAKMN